MEQFKPASHVIPHDDLRVLLQRKDELQQQIDSQDPNFWMVAGLKTELQQVHDHIGKLVTPAVRKIDELSVRMGTHAQNSWLRATDELELAELKKALSTLGVSEYVS